MQSIRGPQDGMSFANGSWLRRVKELEKRFGTVCHVENVFLLKVVHDKQATCNIMRHAKQRNAYHGLSIVH